MTSIGDRLRHQRLQNRISLETVALETKISVRLLEAMEAEQFEKLPGGVFRRSFVLQYARALGLDPDEIAGELKHLTQFEEVPALPTTEMIPDHRPASGWGFRFPDIRDMEGSTFGSLLAAIGVMMVCSLIYSWWQAPRQTPPAMASAPVATVAPTTVIAAPLAGDRPEPPPLPVAAEAPSAGAAPVRVGLSADEPTWVSISSDGKNVFASALQPHETKVVEASEKIRILVGNAGGVEISLNGKPIGPIGPKGQIRVVELTSAGFQIVPRKSPTLEPL